MTRYAMLRHSWNCYDVAMYESFTPLRSLEDPRTWVLWDTVQLFLFP